MSEPSNDSGSLRVNLKDVYGAVMDTRTDVAVIKESMGSTSKDVKDHENRLRKLEQWRYALPTSMILAVGSTVATVLLAVHK